MTPARSTLPPGVLVAWYGDDFTGSAAVMEVMSFAGLDAVLFLRRPSEAQRARFASVRGIGLASTARAQGPAWMDAHLPADFEWLAGIGAPICHYKICSTLDSSPEVGSIGRAIEHGQSVFQGACVPLLVAAPKLRRYQVFGHLFAAAGTDVYRLDRHPVMSRHPVTPMDDADVCRHLARQTVLPIALISIEDLASTRRAHARMEAASAGGPTVCAIDVLSAQDLSRAGELIWTGRQRARFVVGSQGIEYALVSHWREQGHLLTNDRVPSLGPVDRIVVVSGSVSPTTHDQIVDAQDHGFDLIPFAATAVTSSQSVIDLEIEAATARALACLESGRSPIVATARGPEDPAVAAFRDAVASSALSPEQANHAVGDALGRVLDATLQRSRVCRGVVAGGDTSGHVMQRMDAFALTAVAQTTPGAALFRLHCDGPRDGIELALKGGQMGARDMFRQIRAGSKAADS